MLSREDNELLCRVGPGTPMSNLMRQYWVPAALSSELPECEGAPLRLRLLGENLIAFRTTSGAVGLIQNHCPHRGTSLFYGRNEDEGLRCVYHGWKFDVTGRCVDMPSEPAESDFKHKVRATAYPCVERGGLVWAYLGSRPTPPPLPELEANMVPEGGIQIYQRECNWMQALEGDIDTGHTVFLHLGGMQAEEAPEGTWSRYALSRRAPTYEVVETDSGVMYGACRPAEDNISYWRIANFLFPFWAMVPTGVLGLEVRARAWIPMDDHHTLALTIGRLPRGTARVGRQTVGPVETLPNTTDWYGRWRLAANASNDYRQDREMQRTRSYSGITGIHLQDQAITESMGPVTDFSFEHMAPSDIMVTQTRRLLLNAVTAHMRNGTLPPGVHDPEVARGARGGEFLAPEGRSLIESYREQLRAATPDGRPFVCASA